MRRGAIVLAVLLSTLVGGAGSVAAQTPRSAGEGDSGEVVSRVALILFDFDSAEPGPVNERIVQEFVSEEITPRSVVRVVGHTDEVGTTERNLLLSRMRAEAVAGLIERGVARYGLLEVTGVGESMSPYRGDLPEIRFFNRTVLIEIRTPAR